MLQVYSILHSNSKNVGEDDQISFQEEIFRGNYLRKVKKRRAKYAEKGTKAVVFAIDDP